MKREPGKRAAHFGEHLLGLVLRPVLAETLHRYLLRQGRSHYEDRSMVIGPNPIRVLIVGAGLAVGYGSTPAGATFPDRLALALAAELKRGIIVETRAQASVRLERTINLIGMAGAATFDVVIWSPTLEETFRGGSIRWTWHLRRIIEYVKGSGRPRSLIVLLGVPAAEGDHLLARVGSSFADRVNARIASVAAQEDRVEYVAVPGRRIESWDTPLFDPAYQGTVIGSLVAVLSIRQREASSRAYTGTVRTLTASAPVQ